MLPDQTGIERMTGTLLLEVAEGRPGAPQRKRMRQVAEVQAAYVEDIPRGRRVSRVRAHLFASTGPSAGCCAESLQGRRLAALQGSDEHARRHATCRLLTVITWQPARHTWTRAHAL